MAPLACDPAARENGGEQFCPAANRHRIVEPEGSFFRHRMGTTYVGGNRQPLAFLAQHSTPRINFRHWTLKEAWDGS